MGKKKIIKERLINSGTFTEAEFKSFIISALRNLTRFWKPKAEALRDARVGRGLYKCSECGIIGPLTLPPHKGKKRKIKNMLVDHTVPIVGIEGFTSYDDWIRRCFVEKKGLQVLCQSCHSGVEGKTQKENNGRRDFLNMKEEFIGKEYGKLIIIDYIGDRKFLCECDCGNKTIVNIYNLKNGHTKSCGCIMGTHKMSGTKFYKTWRNINSRCNNPNSTGYKYYGGRGIICEWNSFDEFYKDMYKSYSEELSIDRINVNGNYCKDNCRWATNKEQANNKSISHTLLWEGEEKTISEWADIIGEKQNTIFYRIKRGWSIGEALGFEERIIKDKSILKEGDLVDVLNMLNEGRTQKEIGEIYGVDGSVISKFIKKHNKTLTENAERKNNIKEYEDNI